METLCSASLDLLSTFQADKSHSFGHERVQVSSCSPGCPIAESMTEMRAVEIYFVVASSVVLATFSLRPLARIIQALARAWHYGTLPYLVKRHRLLGPITYTETLALMVYLAASTLAILVGSSSTNDISSRSAILAISNYLILFLGGSSSILIYALGISWLPVSKIHTTIAIVVAVKCMIHILLEIPHVVIDTRCICAERPLGRLVRFTHHVLALATLWCIYMHVKTNGIRIALVATGSLSLVGSFAKVLRIAYRSYLFGTERAQIEVVRRQSDAREDAVRILVPLRKKWDFRAGQYVRLCVPQASITALMQMHPFMVYYWAKHTRNGRDIWYLGLLIQPRRGFTANLIRARSAEVTALIDGPYGKPYRHLRNYGTIILVASGMGVAPLIPVIREALDFMPGESCLRKVHLLWDAEEYCRYLLCPGPK
ncbi:uncharacterized protein MYCFIDRAFT_173895 [Pseudocercospora fijiensis CIRAD86]|uniref:FAD-binding FR-type domain-containing protein n=1 Tax=Pseudocercospora fijiensis (strain CIRAD86) TaxID=383855 RepID=M3B6Q6_PSEFD|nr:uncharacterized protein MYCFIDRAFT_173895 [Pseudocercospora fijiensis CIRAD86]EME85023.1 hypothetical protein MYCFIDRAFT_173895 [Pseudocercospora fijiensis CIRAD86]